MNNNVVPLVCPECKSQNVQSEGFLLLCLDCGYKWEDAPNDEFNESKSTISEHISNIFKEGELDEKVVVRKFRTTTQHGAINGKTQSKEVKYYNLDVIKSALSSST